MTKLARWIFFTLSPGMALLSSIEVLQSTDVATGGQKMLAEWKTGAAKQAVQKIVSALSVSMTHADVEKSRQTYSLLLRHDLEALGDINMSIAKSIFNQNIADRLREITQLSIEGRKKVLERDTIASQVIVLSDLVERAGEDVLKGQLFTAENKGTIVQAKEKLNQLHSVLKNFPELEGRLGMKISESLLDCRFLLEGGQPTSLRLAKFSEHLSLQKTHQSIDRR
jgi:hypothetical protein